MNTWCPIQGKFNKHNPNSANVGQSSVIKNMLAVHSYRDFANYFFYSHENTIKGLLKKRIDKRMNVDACVAMLLVKYILRLVRVEFNKSNDFSRSYRFLGGHGNPKHIEISTRQD